MSGASYTSLTVSKSLQIPSTQHVETESIRAAGSIIYDSISNRLYISTPSGWKLIGSTEDTSGSSSGPRTRGGIVQDITASSVTVGRYLRIPRVPSIVGWPLQQPGSIVYDESNGAVYTSTGIAWVDPAAGGVNLTNGGTVGSTSLVAYGIGPNLQTKGLIAGVGVSIVSSLSDVTISASGASGVNSVTAGNSTIVITGTASDPIISGGYISGAGIGITVNSIANTGVITLAAANSTVVIGGTSQNPTVSGNYAAGTGVSIVGNTISGNYIAGSGISVIGNVISNTGVLAVTAANSTVVVGGTAANPTVAGNYSAGSGINIAGNVISAVGVPSITGFSSRKNGSLPLTYPVDNDVQGWTTVSPPNSDTIGSFNSVTGVFTAVASTLHQMSCSVSLDLPNNSGTYALSIRINGTDEYITEDQPQSNSLNSTVLRIDACPYLVIGDVVVIHLLQSSVSVGTNIVVLSSPKTWWSVVQL